MELVPIDRDNLRDLVCLPGGLELAGKTLLGELSQATAWHRKRLEEGMHGFVAYAAGRPRGFVETMPAEAAPFPIAAPGACVLLCFHWAGTEPDDPLHLAEERRMLEATISEVRRTSSGIAALGWDHPTHYPIRLLAALGFREIVRDEAIALMWLAFRDLAPEPRLAPARFRARDLSGDGLLAIDAAWSSRCPYSIHFAERLRLVVENHPDRERLSLERHAIDTREDAFRLAASPWDWGWVYLNGRSINPFAFPGDSLAREIEKHVPGARATL